MSDFSKKVIDEAYAKVIWGEQPGEVINWLVHEKGFTGHQAKELAVSYTHLTLPTTPYV